MTGALPSTEGSTTWDDFIALDDDDRRELVDGHLVEIEVPNFCHEAAVACLVEHLRCWARKHDAGHVLASGYKVRITARRGAMPDVQMVGRDASRPENLQGLAHGRPRLVVEVVSPSSRRYDRVVKLGWYATAAIPEYWIVDPEARTVERLVLERGRYAIAQTASDGAFEPEGYDGLAIPFDELFPESEP